MENLNILKNIEVIQQLEPIKQEKLDKNLSNQDFV